MLDFLKNRFQKKKGPASSGEEPVPLHADPLPDIPGLVIDPVFGGYWDSTADVSRTDVYKHWFLLEEGADPAASVRALSAWAAAHKGGACIRFRSEADLPDPDTLNALLEECRPAGIHLIRAISEPAGDEGPFLDYADGCLYRIHEVHGWGQADDAASVTEYWLLKIPTEEEAAESRRQKELAERRRQLKSYWNTMVRKGYREPADADGDFLAARARLAELEKKDPEKEPTYNLQCLARNRIRDQKSVVAHLEKVRAYMAGLQGLPCTPGSNQDKYLWLKDFPVLTASFRISECPALPDSFRESFGNGNVIHTPDAGFRDLVSKKTGTITVHVLYGFTGDSYEDGYERSYYRLKGSSVFDAFLKTIPEEDGPWTTNRVLDLASVKDCPEKIRGLYCTMEDTGRGTGRMDELTYDGIGFILREKDDSLQLTLIGNDPEEFVAAARELGLLD